MKLSGAYTADTGPSGTLDCGGDDLVIKVSLGTDDIRESSHGSVWGLRMQQGVDIAALPL